MAERKHKRLGDWVIRDVYQRGGVWYGRIRNVVTGRFRYLSTREANRRRGEQAVINWVNELESQKQDPNPTMGIRFDRAFEEFLALKDVRASTLGDYTRTFEKVFKPAFGERFVSEIELKDVERFLKTHHLRKAQLSARTKQKYLVELRAFYRWALRHSYCLKDPTSGVKIGRVAKKQGKALTPEEAQRLLAACQSPIVCKVKYSNRASAKQEYQPPAYLVVAVLIALHTGLRRGNVVRLRWGQIDLAKRTIAIAGEEMKGHTDFTVPIHPELDSVFRSLLKGKRKINPKALVLGQPFFEITTSFKSALERAKLPKEIRWHDLRHTFATWVGQKATFVVYRALLGHSPGSVSERYFHPPFEELCRVIDGIPNLLPNGLAMAEKQEPRKQRAKARQIG